MAEVEDRGRDQRERSSTARARRPDLSKFYSRLLPDITPGVMAWELTLIRPKEPPIDIDSVVESFTWTDEATELSGNLQCHRPDPETPDSLPIGFAQRVRLRVKWRDKWHDLWTMRTKPPQSQLDTNTISIDLADDLDLLKGTKRDWSFRKTKNRNHGYTAHEIALLVAQRAGIKVRKLAKATHQIDKLVKNNTFPLDVIKAAYAEERKATGRNFVVRLRAGELEVVPLARNRLLYVFSKQIQAASIQAQPKGDRPFTALTGHAHLGKGSHAKKITHTEVNRKAAAKLGYMHQDKTYGNVSSSDALRSKVRKDLAEGLKIEHTADITHTGIPFIGRGDGVALDLPKEGFKGRRQFVYVDSASHNVSAGSYTTDFTFTSKDPFIQAQEDAAKAKREAARKARNARKKKKK